MRIKLKDDLVDEMIWEICVKGHEDESFVSLVVVLIVILVFLIVVIIVSGRWFATALGRWLGGRSLASCLGLIRLDLLLVASLVLGGERLVLGLHVSVNVLPATTEFLGNVADARVGHDHLHLGTLVVTEPKEGGQRALRGIGVLGTLALLALLTLRGLVVGHLGLVSLAVFVRERVEALLLLVGHGLPAFSTLLGELGEDDILIGVLLLVLLAAGLHEEGVGGHSAARLGGVLNHVS